MGKAVKQIIATLQKQNPAPSLLPEKIWSEDLSRDIAELSVHDAAKAALHLWNDDLQTAHRIAQTLETETGSFIHAVMHCREGDYANSKYWFRRCRHHPVVSILQEKYPAWDPFEFVDQCETASQQKKFPLPKELQNIQAGILEAIAFFTLK